MRRKGQVEDQLPGPPDGFAFAETPDQAATPASIGRRAAAIRTVCLVLGALLIVTVILSPIGVALIVWGSRESRRLRGGARQAPAPIVVAGGLETALDDLGEPFLGEWELPVAAAPRPSRIHTVQLRGERGSPDGAPPRYRTTRWAPKYEKAFVEGVNSLLGGRVTEAIEWFVQAKQIGSSEVVSLSFLAGYLAGMIDGREDEAIRYLEEALQSNLPVPDWLMSKYLQEARITLLITADLKTRVRLDKVAGAMSLAELYRQTGDLKKAAQLLESLTNSERGRSLAIAALARLRADAGDWDALVRLTDGIGNDSDAACQTLIFRARAMAAQDQHAAALRVLEEALRMPDRDQQLLKAALYERGKIHESMGHEVDARADFERVYALDSTYADVASRMTKPTKGP